MTVGFDTTQLMRELGLLQFVVYVVVPVVIAATVAHAIALAVKTEAAR